MAPDTRALALTLAAVFLALGLGVAIGATYTGDGLEAAQAAVLDRLEAEFVGLRDDLRQLRQQVESAQRLVDALVPAALAGRLEGLRVRLVVWGADESALGATVTLAAALRTAGVSALDAYVWHGPAPTAAEALELAQATVGLPAQRAEPLTLTASGGAGAGPRPLPAPPDAAVLVRGGGAQPDAEGLRALVVALRTSGVRVVAFEPGPPTLRPLWRRWAVPAVGGASPPAAHVAVVLLLLGAEGQFGGGPGAEGLLPPPPGGAP